MRELTPAREYDAKRFALLAKIAIFTVIGLIVGPIIGLALKGLLGLCVVGAIGLTAMAVAPALGDRAANWRLKLIKSEAAKNPIETLENEFGKRTVELEQRKEAIGVFISRVEKFKGKIKTFKTEHPEDESIKAYEERLQQMGLLLDNRKRKFKEAQLSLSIFSREIDKAKDIWELSLAAIEADESAGSVEDEFERRIKVNTSLNAVQDNLTLAFAQLDVELLESKEPEKLPKLPV